MQSYTLVPVDEPQLCCGSAGSYSILQRRLASELRACKLAVGTVIPLVIALGYGSQDARIERQWRKSLTDLIVEH